MRRLQTYRDLMQEWARAARSMCICAGAFDRRCPVNAILRDRQRGAVQGLFSVGQKHGITVDEVRDHLEHLNGAMYEA